MDNTHPLPDSDIGTTVFVTDGLSSWALYFSDDEVGVPDGSGHWGPLFYPSPEEQFSPMDYHHYVIQFHQNGPGTDDDTADYYIDGQLIFGDVSRIDVLPASIPYWIHFGGSGSAPTSDAHYELVRLLDSNPVVYTCDGFFPPLANSPVKVKKNRTLPHKAELLHENGAIATDTDLPALPVIQVLYSSSINVDAIDVTDEALAAGHGTDGNEFVFTEDMLWQFNLKTKNYTAPGTYTVTMESGDDSEYVIEPTCTVQFIIE